MINKIIGGFITVIVGASLLPLFAQPSQLIGWTIEEKPTRQTYLEYVKERLEVEEMLK